MRFYTIGHSDHTTEEFMNLLAGHGVTAIADARTQPYSRYAPQFNREVLREDLRKAGIRYVYLGHLIGGRPTDPSCYLPDGHVDYGRLRTSPPFIEGLERLERGAETLTVAVLCSEEDPARCHRHLAVAVALIERGHQVLHIRASGDVVDEADLARAQDTAQAEQLTMFAGEETAEWRSIPSDSPSEQQRTSSRRSNRSESSG